MVDPEEELYSNPDNLVNTLLFIHVLFLFQRGETEGVKVLLALFLLKLRLKSCFNAKKFSLLTKCIRSAQISQFIFKKKTRTYSEPKVVASILFHYQLQCRVEKLDTQ